MVLGITGCPASGKTTSAGHFKALGLPVFDADATVAALYAGDLPAAAGKRLDRIVPGCHRGNRIIVDRIAQAITHAPNLLSQIESIVHPHVTRARHVFMRHAAQRKADWVVIDVPLLFETGLDAECARILVTTAPEATRSRRLRARRNGVSALGRILSNRQIADEDKARKADYLLDSSRGITYARIFARCLISELRADVPPSPSKLPASLEPGTS